MVLSLNCLVVASPAHRTPRPHTCQERGENETAVTKLVVTELEVTELDCGTRTAPTKSHNALRQPARRERARNGLGVLGAAARPSPGVQTLDGACHSIGSSTSSIRSGGGAAAWSQGRPQCSGICSALGEHFGAGIYWLCRSLCLGAHLRRHQHLSVDLSLHAREVRPGASFMACEAPKAKWAYE